jgi:glutamate-1-semialdehyde 2,1-aminomutase
MTNIDQETHQSASTTQRKNPRRETGAQMTTQVLDGWTEERIARARRVIPNGASSAWRSVHGEAIVRAQGAYLWNAEGRRYIDCLCAWGPIVIGHCDPRINQAVVDSINTVDLNAVGPHAGEVELAEAICEVMPCAEKVAFCQSGTDTTLHTVHAVRAFTGKRKLLKFHGSYHGWHDSLAVGVRYNAAGARGRSLTEPEGAGLHPGALSDVIVVEWNDLAAVADVFAARADELAGVVCEPYAQGFGCVAPAPGFLEGIRALCTKHGVPLVFDEVKTGFRHHVGGYQALCGVTPDITAFSKALGNGFAIGGVAGRDEIMSVFEIGHNGMEAIWDGTSNASPYAMAAGLATLSILRDGGIARLNALGERMRQGLREAIAATGAVATVAGVGASWMVYFLPAAPKNYREALLNNAKQATVYNRTMREAGIMEPLVGLGDRRLCLAMTEDDVDETIGAARRALSKAKGAQ